MTEHQSQCSIEQVGKQRNGRPRYWCSVHGASATGRYGARLSECESAYRDTILRNVLELDPEDYLGGVALWGAVPAVFDTSGLPPEVGVHVHARQKGDRKEIDATFDEVALSCKRDLLDNARCIITAEAAVAYYISRFLKRDIQHLYCSYCGELHLDKGFFAVKPHRRHLCHGCGRYFQVDRKGVSNPIALLRANLHLPSSSQDPVRPNRPLDIQQIDYPGGIQIWASNPALLWTADRPEDEGLHVHGFCRPGAFAFDETYSSVIIDKIRIDEVQVQYLMAQMALPYLANKIVSLKCPSCSAEHFDQGELAFCPHSEHVCETCGKIFVTPGRRRLVVSNPFVATRGELYAASPKRRSEERSPT
jgi:transposase-like protein